ncbi:hypothetical protein LTR10_012189 [Elasticomyces elasticus]|nr:hypothetical protein LTR10_012189 [Elasticomyces elasticus]
MQVSCASVLSAEGLAVALRRLGIKVFKLDLSTHADRQLEDLVENWSLNFCYPGCHLVLAYIGHGDLENGRLMVFGSDFTAIQERLRDDCYSDVLFILDTCFAGTELGETGYYRERNHTVETLAAGMDETSSCSWMWGLIETLNEIPLSGWKTIEEIHQIIHKPKCVESPGVYRSEIGGRQSMRLTNSNGWPVTNINERRQNARDYQQASMRRMEEDAECDHGTDSESD